MISHRSNAGAPPVAAPPVAPDAQRVTAPHGVTDANVADLNNAPSPPIQFFKKSNCLASNCVAAASLLSVVCIASLSPRHPDTIKLSSALGSPARYRCTPPTRFPAGQWKHFPSNQQRRRPNSPRPKADTTHRAAGRKDSATRRNRYPYNSGCPPALSSGTAVTGSEVL